MHKQQREFHRALCLLNEATSRLTHIYRLSTDTAKVQILYGHLPGSSQQSSEVAKLGRLLEQALLKRVRDVGLINLRSAPALLLLAASCGWAQSIVVLMFWCVSARLAKTRLKLLKVFIVARVSR